MYVKCYKSQNFTHFLHLGLISCIILAKYCAGIEMLVTVWYNMRLCRLHIDRKSENIKSVKHLDLRERG